MYWGTPSSLAIADCRRVESRAASEVSWFGLINGDVLHCHIAVSISLNGGTAAASDKAEHHDEGEQQRNDLLHVQNSFFIRCVFYAQILYYILSRNQLKIRLFLFFLCCFFSSFLFSYFFCCRFFLCFFCYFFFYRCIFNIFFTFFRFVPRNIITSIIWIIFTYIIISSFFSFSYLNYCSTFWLFLKYIFY